MYSSPKSDLKGKNPFFFPEFNYTVSITAPDDLRTQEKQLENLHTIDQKV